MSEFKHNVHSEGDILHVDFNGVIDEEVTFPVLDATNISKLQINLSGITAINSVGIREWMDWIKPYSEKLKIVLENCPKAIVYQFNMVEGFLPPKAEVTSFFAPYFCEKCDIEQNLLFTVGKEISVAGGSVQVNIDPKTSVNCKEASCSIELDTSPAKYFRFLVRG